MIQTSRLWHPFNSNTEKLKKLKEWGLISDKALVIKQLLYKGAFTNGPVPCEVIGYVDDNEIIISVNGEEHSIMPDYLKDMQKKDFKLGSGSE